MRKICLSPLVVCWMMALALTVSPRFSEAAETHLTFSGGPEGGTFRYFSKGIAERLSETLPDAKITDTVSEGSVENLLRLNSDSTEFGIVYSGDLFQGRHGYLTEDKETYGNVRALAYLYGAPAQLITPEDSGIQAVAELAGKKVAVGAAGSGAAVSAERYFQALGLWEQMQPQFIGYSKAVDALEDKLVDAVWVLAGFPNPSVTEAAGKIKIRILDTLEAGHEAGFFHLYPLYTEVTIPAGTYRGIDKPVKTFQDAALWVAGKHVDADLVYASLQEIFSPDGLAYMVEVKDSAKEMSVATGLNGIVTPLHPGAIRFWTEKGLSITKLQKGKVR